MDSKAREDRRWIENDKKIYVRQTSSNGMKTVDYNESFV